MSNSNYYIGANDEHGQNPPTAGKRTPIMPFLNRQIYENEFNRPTKNKFIEACLRNGFRVYDVKPELQDIALSTRVRRINAQNLTLLVTFAYNAFGTGLSFNTANGFETFYSVGNPRPVQSKELAEEIFEKLAQGTEQKARRVDNLNIAVLSNVNCVSALVEAGFMTNLREAKLMIDPDFQTEVAEETCQGVCAYLGVPYITRNDLKNYPLLRSGSRGNFVMLLQFLLYNYGYDIDIDGIFGPATQRAVILFQQENGLDPDGLVGNNTWRTLLQLPPFPTLRRGSRGVYVKYLQQKLEAKLYPVGVVDGVFGSNTELAVKQFQTENGLNADGIVGPLTWAQLAPIGGGRDGQ